MKSVKGFVLFVFMAGFVAALASVPAHAHSARVAVDIPFDFAVGSTHLKAGSYKVETEGALGAFIAISQEGGKTTYALPTQSSGANDGDRHPYLVFNRYGAESFLTRIVFSSTRTYDLPTSSREKEMMARTTQGEQLEVPAGGSR